MRLTDEGAMRGVADLALANFAWCAAAYKDDASLVTGDASRAQSLLLAAQVDARHPHGFARV
ncbi:hypothetical protein [Demequina litorisediminis]|uniref:hypothetical protein n=1 Tax=Demequina litorisediminis TaxID=1849022 RepID=UPI0024E0C9C5|nr:hypothetical protein [Demequina litorisediminis]